MKQNGFTPVLLLLVVSIIAVAGGAYYFLRQSMSLPLANTPMKSTITFSAASSLQDGQKLGVWNAPDVKFVKTRNEIPKDGSSYVDMTSFDSTIKNLSLSATDQSDIGQLVKEAIPNLFVEQGKGTDFLSRHFIVKSVKVSFKADTYKQNYTFADGELKLVIEYEFKYDWFSDKDSMIIIQTSDGQGVGTNGLMLQVEWFDFQGGRYVKNANPTTIPNFNFPKLNSDQYPVFRTGFSKLISEQRVKQIVSERLPETQGVYGMNLQIIDSSLYPAVTFSNSGQQDKKYCGGKSDPNIKFIYDTCVLNASNEELKCETREDSCLQVIPLLE